MGLQTDEISKLPPEELFDMAFKEHHRLCLRYAPNQFNKAERLLLPLMNRINALEAELKVFKEYRDKVNKIVG